GGRPGDRRGDLRSGVRRRAVREGAARRAAVAQGRRVPQPGRDRRGGRGQRAPPATHRDRGDRQPREGCRGTGDSEHERDAWAARDGGTRMLRPRVVELGGKELARSGWLATFAWALLCLVVVILLCA